MQGGGSLIPYKTKTDLTTKDLSIKLGKGFSFGERSEFQITPYAAMGSYRWERDSSSDPYGYLENYKHRYAGGGLMIQFEASSRLVLKADCMLGRMIGPNMTVASSGTRYDLGKKNVSTFAVGADYALTKKLHLSAEYRNTRFDYGQSAAIGTSYEPYSETRREQFFIGAGMQL